MIELSASQPTINPPQTTPVSTQPPSATITNNVNFLTAKNLVHFLPQILIGIAVLIIISLATSYFNPRTISTVGLAQQDFTVGKAQLTLVYLAQSSDASGLRDDSVRKVSTLVDDLSNLGAASIISGTPQVIPQQISGSQFRQTIQLEATGTDTITAILTFLRTQNVVVTSAQYFPKDESSAQAALLTDSTNNALEKAKLLADSQSLKITGIRNVTETASTVEVGSSLSGAADNATSVSSINSGKTKLQKTVNATFNVRKKILFF